MGRDSLQDGFMSKTITEPDAGVPWGRLSGVQPLVKIKRDFGGSAPSIEHTVGWMNS